MMFLVGFIACNKAQEAEPENPPKLKKPIDVPYLKGNWKMVNSNFIGKLPYDEMIGFAIGDKCYFGLEGNPLGNFMNDLWEYDVKANKWQFKTSFVGTKRGGGAINLVLNDKFYYGLGEQNNGKGSLFYQKDIWEYNTFSNQWSKKTEIPQHYGRASAFAFSLENKIFVGGGTLVIDSTLLDKSIMRKSNTTLSGTNNPKDIIAVYTDFWEYDIASNIWSKKNNTPFFDTHGFRAFSVKNKAYVISSIGQIWLYDKEKDTWLKKSKSPRSKCFDDWMWRIEPNRSLIAVVDDKVYMASSSIQTFTMYDNSRMCPEGMENADFWEYNTTTDTWQKICEPDINTLVRFSSVCSIKDKIYFLGATYYKGFNNDRSVIESKTFELWELNLEK